MPTEQEFAQKFLGDENFRQEFKSDPKASMRAHGVDVPEGIEIVVVESTPQKHYVAMPPLQSGEISDEQLAGVSGGGITILFGTMDC